MLWIHPLSEASRPVVSAEEFNIFCAVDLNVAFSIILRPRRNPHSHILRRKSTIRRKMGMQ